MREGNKNWIKGGTSPNPRGRPKKGMTAADIVASHISGDDLVKRMVAKLDQLNASGKNEREQVVLFQILASYILGKPVDTIDLNVNQKTDGEWSPPPQWSIWSGPQRMEYLHAMRQRALTGATDDDIQDAEFTEGGADDQEG